MVRVSEPHRYPTRMQKAWVPRLYQSMAMVLAIWKEAYLCHFNVRYLSEPLYKALENVEQP